MGSDCVGKLDDLLVQRFDQLERLSKYTEIVLKRAHRRERVRKPPHMIANTLGAARKVRVPIWQAL
jgi:hypothetical protein